MCLVSFACYIEPRYQLFNIEKKKGERVRILITGGAGFIGSHLTEAYLQEGHDVYVLDNLSTGSLENLRHLQDNSKFSNHLFFTEGSILDTSVLLELVGTCDFVVHLAAAVGVEYILANPLASIITNVRGTENVLEMCAKFKKKVLIASTSEVYGKHEHAPLREGDDCVYGSSDKCRWSYAAGKLMDEFTSLAYFRTHGLPVMIVRLFNTVGPRQTGRYGMVIPRFVRQALSEAPITVFGDGNQSRTFTHVQDVVIALMKLLKTPAAVGEVINIGGFEEISIKDLALRIKTLTHSRSEIKLIPYSDAYSRDYEDMQRRVPSTEKLSGLIGHTPSLELDAILQDVIRYFEKKSTNISQDNNNDISFSFSTPSDHSGEVEHSA